MAEYPNIPRVDEMGRFSPPVLGNLDDRYLSPGTPVSEYGAVGDGVTDDAPAIRAAVTAAAGAPVLFEPGATYLVGTALDFTGVDVDFRCYGAEPATLYHNGQSFTPLTISGTSGVATTTATGDLSAGTFFVPVASTAGFAAGQTVTVVSDKLWYHDNRSAVYKSELNVVARVETGRLLLEDPLNDGYPVATETVTVTGHNPVRVNLENLTVRLVSPPTGARGTTPAKTGIRVRYAWAPTLRDVSVENAAAAGIGIDYSWRPTITGGHVHTANDYNTGYGVSVNACTHTRVTGAKFWECRRGVDITGGPVICRDSLIENCINYGGGANSEGTDYGYYQDGDGYRADPQYGFGTHGGADWTTYRGNIAACGYAGFSCRGRNEVVDDNLILGRQYDGAVVASFGSNLTLTRNRVMSGVEGGGKEKVAFQTGATYGSRLPTSLLYIWETYEGEAEGHLILRDNDVFVQECLLRLKAGMVPQHVSILGNRVRYAPHNPDASLALVKYEGTDAPALPTSWAGFGNDAYKMSGNGNAITIRGVTVGSARLANATVT